MQPSSNRGSNLTIPPALTLAQERKLKQKLWLEKLQRLEQKELWLKEHPLIPQYRPRLSDPPPFWLVFFRQKQAFECTAIHPQDVHPFAFEPESHGASPSNKGLRKYLVTSHAQLWHSIKSLDRQGRHGSFYEVISEGAVCKLYFDLEFSRDLNPGLDGAAMVQTLIEFTCHELQKVYNIHCSSHHVINLDASTGSKFSCHLIFNIPGAVFRDNLHAGYFVRHLCREIEAYTSDAGHGVNETDVGDERSDCNGKSHDQSGEPAVKKRRDGDTTSSEESGDHRTESQTLLAGGDANGHGNFPGRRRLKNLYVEGHDGQRALFIDTAVYTRNRNFRLYKCVKLCKANPLLVAADNKYQVKSKKPADNKGGEEFKFFLDSIITNVRFAQNVRVLTFDGPEGSTEVSCRSHHVGQDVPTSRVGQGDSPSTTEGYRASPFPAIDGYVKAHCISRGGVTGEIRRWTYFSQTQLLVYDVVKNRWCDNIGRQHKSNNIMILVDLRRGVHYQKCHDPSCRAQGYKSDERFIPAEHLPSFTDWDEEELIAITERAEQLASKSAHHHEEEGELESNAEDLEAELIRLAETLESHDAKEDALALDRSGVGLDGPCRREEKQEQCSQGSANEWDSGITDDELMRSFQE